MITGDDETTILEVIPPSELHLLTGPVNTLYEGLNKVWKGSEQWLSACNVKKTEYHGGSFAGNESRKLLKSTDTLGKLCAKKHKKYVDAFCSFNEVVKSCYSKTLH